MSTIISIASGKGGVGKSMVASNLALVLAKRGNRVTLVDLDTGGANLHVLFGLFRSAATLTDFLEHRQKSLQSIVQPLPIHPNLFLIVGTGDTLVTANLPTPKRKRLVKHLRKLQGHFTIVDIGAGTNYHALDFFLSADRYVTVATPDPTSVLDAYRFIKLAAVRKVLSAFMARDPAAEALSHRDFQNIEEVLAAVGQANEDGKAIAEHVLRSFNPSLILNRMSERSKVNTGHLQQLVQQYIGTELVVLGRIPNDEAVEQSIRKYLPVVDFKPSSPAAIAFEQVADQLETWLATGMEPETVSTQKS